MKWQTKIMSFNENNSLGITRYDILNEKTENTNRYFCIYGYIDLMMILIIMAKVIAVITKAIIIKHRSSHPEMFLGKGVLKICSKYTEEHTC